MVRERCASAPIRTKLTMFVVSVCLISSSYGALVDSGSLVIDANNGTDSFAVQVDYELYDGASEWRLELVLDHLGHDGVHTSSVDIGRFTAFAPAGTGAGGHEDFYLSISATGTGVAPHQGYSYGLDPYELTLYKTDLTDPNTDSNRGHFYFQDDSFNGDFGEGDGVTQTLVLEMVPLTSEVDIILEIDYPYASPQFDGDETLHLVPEPASAVLLGAASLLFLRRRKRI